MGFDVTNPDHLTLLKNEAINDPVAMGYPPDLGGHTRTRLRLFNDPDNNVRSDPVKDFAQTELTPETLADAVDVTEYAGDTGQNIGNARGLVNTFMRLPPGSSLERWRAKIVSIFNSSGATNTALNNQTRHLSRVEAMRDPADLEGPAIFGPGTVITEGDWLTARDSA